MKRYLTSALVFVVFSAPVHAQSNAATDDRPSQRQSSSDDVVSVVATVTPRIGSSLRTESRSQEFDDAVAVSNLGLRFEVNKGSDLPLTLEAGAKWTTDFEDDALPDGTNEASSALYAKANLKLKSDCRFQPFLKTELTHGRVGFFEEEANDNFSFGIGADWSLFSQTQCPKEGANPEIPASAFALTITPGISRQESTDATVERWTPGITFSASREFDAGVTVKVNLDYQFRMYDEVETGSDRTHYYGASVRVDFSGMLPPRLGFVTDLSLGISGEISDREDTGLLQDASKFAFTPSISFKFPY